MPQARNKRTRRTYTRSDPALARPRTRTARNTRTQAPRMSRTTLIGATVVALLVIVGLAFFLTRPGALSGTGEEDVVPTYYDWDGFTKRDGRYTYTDGNATARKTGVDVSDHQGWIDWNAVKSDGIDFAIIRLGYRGITEGDVYRDDYFDYNIAAAKEAGVERGVYFFSQAIDEQEAIEEAQFVIDALAGERLEYPVVFDLEVKAGGATGRASQLTREQAAAIANAFCEHIEAAGYEAMLYGNAYDLDRYDPALIGGWPIWFAEYGSLPSYTEPYVIWQYANEGDVDGIDTIVDMNLDFSALTQQPSSEE